nr:nitroreductase family protein [Tepidibacter aestuarii]
MQAILERRSIRKYEEKEVSDEIVKELLKAAMAAPSSNNMQPWEFLVIRNKEQMSKIVEAKQAATPLMGASVAIAVCADLNVYKGKPNLWVQDCSAATQNILLASHAKGLGAVWISIYPVETRTKKVQDILGLPEEIIPVSIISIGYPGELKEPSNRYNESKVHFYKW